MSPHASTVQNDLASLIPPNTNLAQHREVGPLVITRGDGIRVFDEQGNAYIEAMSDLWSVAVEQFTADHDRRRSGCHFQRLRQDVGRRDRLGPVAEPSVNRTRNQE